MVQDHEGVSPWGFESATAGIPVIVTAGTTMDDSLREYGAGLTVADGDAEDLANKILAVAADAASFRERAHERMSEARAYNSPSKFMDRLWDRLPQPKPSAES